MRHENFVVFHNGTDTSYMNSADNFRGAEIGAAQEIDIYFESALSTGVGGSYDRVRLHVKTAGDEEKALEAIAGALQGNKSGLTVMADDVNSVYFSDFFDAVTSFTTASNNQRIRVKAVTVATDLEASDSGSLITISQASGAYNITLPTVAEAGAGWHADFILVAAAANAVAIINDASEDKLIGTAVGGDGNSGTQSASAVDSVTFISGATVGDRCRIICDGNNFFVEAQGADAAHVTID